MSLDGDLIFMILVIGICHDESHYKEGGGIWLN